MRKAAFLAALAMLLILVAWLAYPSDDDRAADNISIEAAEPVVIAKSINHLVEAAAEPPKHYTDADAVALAQMAWGECRGVGRLLAAGSDVSPKCQQAAAMWVALNRYDAGFEDSIIGVVSARKQFVGYDPEHPVDAELLALSYDVLERWNAEKNGDDAVGRVLPADYFWFHGDGKHNHFQNEYRSGRSYTWELPDIYADWSA